MSMIEPTVGFVPRIGVIGCRCKLAALPAGLLMLAFAFGYSGGNVALAAKNIGVAAAVLPDVRSTAPDQAARVLWIGVDIVADERVVTTDKGRTQLLFLDGSALTIGPNSDVVVDEFVYDPSAKTGRLAFSATKGLFRLVGGKISKKTAVIFKTPTAVIGIRGGIGIIAVREVGGQANAKVVTTAQLAFGRMTVQSGGVTRTINIPGFEVVAENPQQAPSRPARAEAKAEGLAGLEGAGGDSRGGAPEAPTNEDVADTQISDLGSKLQPQIIVSAPLAGVAPPPPPPGKDPVATQKNVSTVSDSTVDAQQNTTLDATAGTEGGVRLTGLGSDFVYGGRFLSQTPFTAFDFNTAQTSRVALRNENGGGARLGAGTLSVSSDVDGTIFKLPVKAGNFAFGSDEGQTHFGPVSGTGFAAPDLSFIYWNLRESQFNNNPSSVFAGAPFVGSFPTSGIVAHDLFPGFPGKTLIPMLPLQYGGDIGGRPRPILYSAYSPNITTFPDDARSVALYGSVAIEGVGASQRSSQVTYIGTYFGGGATNNKILLSGLSRGSVRLTASSRPLRVDGGGGVTSDDGSGNSFFGTNRPDYFVISSDFTDAVGNRLDAAGFGQTLEDLATPLTFFHETYTQPAPLPIGVGSSRTSQTLNGYFTGLAASATGTFANPAFSVYIASTLNASPSNFEIVTNASTNRLFATVKTEDVASVQSSLVLPLSNPSGSARSRQAFIDDNIFGIRDSSSLRTTVGGAAGKGRVMLSTSAFTNLTGNLTTGVSFCTCAFTKWGFFSGDVRLTSGFERHRFHLMPWVAGRLSGPLITASQTGTASYTGHVAANIKDGGNQYVAFGNYDQSWNFATRSGSATISNLDGATYTGSIAGATGTQGSRFVGSISGAGRSGSLQGAFMQGANSNVGEVGAQFHVVGGGYTAAGVAVAKQP